MTIFSTIILLAAIIATALVVAYNMQRGTKPMSEFKLDFDNEQIEELPKELFNKELRPVAPKVPTKSKEVTSQDITPQTIVQAIKVAKAAPSAGTVNVEAVAQEIKKDKRTKSEFPIDKPNNKRK